MLKRNIGTRVKYFRELKNLTQADLAEALDVSVETIYNCEAGRKMSLNLLEKLSGTLDVPIVDFFKNEDDYNKNKKSKLFYEIELLCKSKSEKELKYIIEMIKLMKKMT